MVKTPWLREWGGTRIQAVSIQISFYNGVSTEWAEAVSDWAESTSSMFLQKNSMASRPPPRDQQLLGKRRCGPPQRLFENGGALGRVGFGPKLETTPVSAQETG